MNLSIKFRNEGAIRLSTGYKTRAELDLRNNVVCYENRTILIYKTRSLILGVAMLLSEKLKRTGVLPFHTLFALQSDYHALT
jgi:hypothetical protein